MVRSTFSNTQAYIRGVVDPSGVDCECARTRMLKKFLLLAVLVNVVLCQSRKHKVEDPFTAFDRHITHSLAYHYLWPWRQLMRAAAAMETEENFGEPQILSTAKKYTLNLNMKRFQPDELKVKVKNRRVIIEGKHKEDEKQILSNHFIQMFELPESCKPEEVTAVYNENGLLTITAPKHYIPPPVDREVPIQVLLPEDKTEKNDVAEASSEKNVSQTTPTPVEQLDLVEATTHAGKIRKKELKTTTKTAKDNEVTKGVDSNGLDYALVESENE